MKKLVLTVLLLTAFGCASTAPPPEPPPASQRLELDRAAHWLRNSAEYEAVVRQTYFAAGARMREVAAGRESGTWAVAVDADETILDNSPYEKELTEKGIYTTDELWDGWVARRAAPPVPGALEFLELVHALGGKIAVVTNRIEDHCADTRANFRAFDIPFDVILCRTEDARKEARWASIERGTAADDLPPLEIVMWVGDNIQDFPHLDQEIRGVAATAYADFGVRFFALPNPIYGSWMDNPKD